MAKKKNAKKSSKTKTQARSGHWRSIGAGLLMFAGFLMLLAQLSFLLYWHADQSAVDMARDSEPVHNWLGKLGNAWAYRIVYQGFGWAGFVLPWLVMLTGWYWFHKKNVLELLRHYFHNVVHLILLATGLGLFLSGKGLAGGLTGMQWAEWLRFYTGGVGAYIVWTILVLLWLVYLFRWEPEQIKHFAAKAGRIPAKKPGFGFKNPFGKKPSETESVYPAERIDGQEETSDPSTLLILDEEPEQEVPASNGINEKPKVDTASEPIPDIQIGDDDTVQNTPETLVQEQGEYDPTLDLSHYNFPTLDLLKDYENTEIVVNKDEVFQNRDIIVDTLQDFNVKVSVKSVTIGPTVTLYEVVPARGVPINKIKAREDDLALALHASGIRIIAPMPGRGTVGIEVPNTNPLIVPMKDVLRSRAYVESTMELPVALGKAIDNSTHVFDLTKAPHLLMAGATGQGKSVGLNVIINSILFRKHPSEVKFVLIDPKRVELSLYNKIEKHFLAKLPDLDNAIISDVTQAKDVLNSLLKEMYERYELLQKAKVRNFKEYNAKFKHRQLNPENGHRFLPYIILVVDEFADLIMATGKEVEVPITKLAQMARAVGIHLIIATQRPSVNVITGTIKANFPMRIAFRVTAKVDSRTILDTGGAEKLIGRGDMLVTAGNDLVRLQCAFIDTDEVEKVADFIGNQPGYASAYELPLPDREDGGGEGLAPGERDELFREAAEIVVGTGQGSTSMLQRKLQIGYNRAGRIMDQLEKAGIVGPARGSKPREVYFQSIMELERFLEPDDND